MGMLIELSQYERNLLLAFDLWDKNLHQPAFLMRGIVAKMTDRPEKLRSALERFQFYGLIWTTASKGDIDHFQITQKGRKLINIYQARGQLLPWAWTPAKHEKLFK